MASSVREVRERLRFAEGVVLRAEYFGGLLFSRRTQSITELNHDSYRLCSLVDGNGSIEDILDKFCGNDTECSSRALDFLMSLRRGGYLA